MEIKEVDISEIKPYEKNAKLHTQTQIDNVAESIKQFGYRQPLVLSKDNVIIIGHCRYEASKKLGLKTVPCVFADDLTDEQVKKLRVLDNKLNESDWDNDLLFDDIGDLEFDGFDIDFDFNNDYDFIDDDEEEDGDEELVNKKLLKCPVCGHVNEEKAFKTYGDIGDEDSK